MIFSDYNFIFLFLPIVFSVYWLLIKVKFDILAKLWLIFASFFFYAQGSPEFVPYFMGSILVNYVIGNSISKLYIIKKKCLESRILLFMGIAANIILLGYFKYAGFCMENFNLIAGKEIELKNIILPIGISFFTFQLIAFLADAYQGECIDYSILDFLLFITFFPQLIVGPIVHHREVIPQFQSESSKMFNLTNISKGLFIFSIGCFKKIMFADVLISDAQGFFNVITETDVLDCIHTWLHGIEYAVAYYFDMSGYADMAIGIGLFFNIILPINFNSPYKSRNFQDYWRRWHITLSKFLEDYIFKCIYHKGSRYRNYYVATMITFLISGLWHGAGWTFIGWGAINGLFVCLASAMKKHKLSLPGFISYPLTALGIVFLWVLFISPSFAYAGNVFLAMLNYGKRGTVKNFLGGAVHVFLENKTTSLTLLAGLVVCWSCPNSGEMLKCFKYKPYSAVLVAILFSICIMNMNHVVSFLYFQF